MACERTMYSYHSLWLSMLVLASLTTTMWCFANNNEIEISESTSANLKHDGPRLETQATATFKDITDAGGGGGAEGTASDNENVDLHNPEYLDRVRVEPSHLDFGVWSVGIVQSQTVTLINQNRNHSVHLSALSGGKTPAFYSSFFEAKTVPPNGNTTFDVVFLPREQGAVSTNLHIHTSFGKLLLMVKGEGRECPYRLKPLVGIRAPLNATLMPMIHMYNPHEKSLQILEVRIKILCILYENLVLSKVQCPQGLWDIPPITTKPIIRIRFQGYTAGNYSAYIRIKIAEPCESNSSSSQEDSNDSENEDVSSSSSSHTKEQILVIPVEFEILSEYGLYAVNPVLEFGYIAINGDENVATKKPMEHKFFLKHSKDNLEANNFKYESITKIKGITMKTPDHQDGNIDGSINGDDSWSAIQINQRILWIQTILNEKLKLVLKDTSPSSEAKTAACTYHNVELIIRANIFKGSLQYDTNSTIFLDYNLFQRNNDTGDQVENTDVLVNSKNESERHIVLRNDFQIPLIIYNLTTESYDDSNSTKLSLQIIQPSQKNSDQQEQLVLQPGRTLDLLVSFRLARDETQQHQQEDLKDLTRNYKTAIYVYTNITNFQIPIVISSTRLFVTTQTQTIWRSNNSVYTKELQLSPVPLREISQKGFIILQNPNAIPIPLKDWDIQKGPGVYFAISLVGYIRSADVDRSNDYSIDLEKTNYNLDREIQPGGGLAVFVITLQPYTTDLSTTHLRIITPYENITIAVRFSIASGKLEVDQEKLHFANCFRGKICSSELSIRSSFKQAIHMKYINFTDPGLRFVDKNPHGSKITPNSVTTVGRIYFEPSALCGTRCYIPQHTDENSVFPASQPNSITTLNMPYFDELELRRRTELYRHFKYYFQNLDFTMTTKTMLHYQLNLMIEIQWPKLVATRQVLPTIEVNKTQEFEVKISNPSDKPILIDYVLSDPRLAKQTQIQLPLEVIILTPSCYLTDKAVFDLVNPLPKRPILIPGLTSIKVPIKFQALSTGSYCTMLHIRNNLTLYEGVWISAKAVQSQFRLGNRKPGSSTPLLFEITEQQMSAACPTKEEDNEKKITQPQVLSRRVFTARNSGELSIWIESFWIGDQPCTGYGFQIVDCKGFELKANSSKSIEIMFQPDFTVTRMEKVLTLKTNLSYAVSYMLVAQLPSRGLDRCTALLPRPPWEEKIRNATIVMLMITFVLVLIAVHIDYGNIMYTQSMIYGAREKGQIHPTFNLRNIAMRSNSQQQSNNDFPETEGEVMQRNKSGFKKRHYGGKNQKNCSNGEISVSPSTSSISSSFAALPNLTLAEMVSWTFGSKTTKKSNKPNKGKDMGHTLSSAMSSASSNTLTNDTKPAKTKFTEKSLMEKMDEDIKKSNKPFKVGDKTPSAGSKAVISDDKKVSKDEALAVVEKDIKKDRQVGTKTTALKSQEVPSNSTSKEQPRESLETSVCGSNSNPSQTELLMERSQVTLPPSQNVTVGKMNSSSSLSITPMTEITNQQIPAKEALTTKARKISRWEKRLERRKNFAQNTSPSPATSTCSSASASSLGSLSQQPNTGSRANERKVKHKTTNSKVSNNFSHSSSSSSSLYISPASIAAEANGHNDQTFNSDSLWDYNSHITFSDVLQQTQQYANSQAASLNPTTPSTLLNTDLMKHSSSLFEVGATVSRSLTPPAAIPNSTQFGNKNVLENAEITAALTPKRPHKPSVNDLGPIGSKKSPSSTPLWESNSAITMQLPRPFNTTIPSTSAPTLPYDLQAPNFGFNDLLTARQTIQQIASANSQNQQQNQQTQQQDFDIAAKLRAIKAHEILRLKHLEEQLLLQQRQQYFNYSHGINNNWSTATTTPWAPFLNNNGAPIGVGVNNMPSCSNSDVFGVSSVSSAPSSTWNTPNAMDNIYSGQHSSVSSDAHTTGSAGGISMPSNSSYDSNAQTVAMNGGGGLSTSSINNVADNMPTFNLFGGLSSIWNDNWKQSTQQQSQKPSPKND
ncbi:LOW QUALITY PROTEIN: transmembrane protein 131 [Haematobia irritans]|uniref:LOW QUALITY PROTEIN: transmembrane protein 131 n=1 Tax=Haematobia irritans TaxID=7368 RepID=UPI003F504A5C